MRRLSARSTSFPDPAQRAHRSLGGDESAGIASIILSVGDEQRRDIRGDINHNLTPREFTTFDRSRATQGSPRFTAGGANRCEYNDVDNLLEMREDRRHPRPTSASTARRIPDAAAGHIIRVGALAFPSGGTGSRMTYITPLSTADRRGRRRPRRPLGTIAIRCHFADGTLIAVTRRNARLSNDGLSRGAEVSLRVPHHTWSRRLALTRRARR